MMARAQHVGLPGIPFIEFKFGKNVGEKMNIPDEWKRIIVRASSAFLASAAASLGVQSGQPLDARTWAVTILVGLIAVLGVVRDALQSAPAKNATGSKAPSSLTAWLKHL